MRRRVGATGAEGSAMAARPNVRYSLLDLVPIREGGSAAEAMRNMVDLARHAERWGYHRYWLAEHHNIPGIASSATAVLIGHVAAATERIRVGSGGVMLPNHSPLAVAEQFGTLETLFPGRIDLGIGRAPGGDMATAMALRRGPGDSVERFPEDVQEVLAYFRPAAPGQAVRAIPGEGLNVPVYLLGSSLFSASLAAALGLPFAFASHFAPDHLHGALGVYRERFRPSEYLERPYVMVGVNAVAAETDEEGARLFTSIQQQFLNLFRGTIGPVPPPVATMEGIWTPPERERIDHVTRYSAVGSPETVRRELGWIIEETGADELILTAQLYDHGARLRSFEIAAAVMREIGSGARVEGGGESRNHG